MEELRTKEKALSAALNMLKCGGYSGKDACYTAIILELAEVQEKINNIQLIQNML